MLSKAKILAVIQSLPDQLSIDDVLDKLLLVQKVEEGLGQSKKNDVIPDQDLDKQLPEWLS